MPTEPGFATRRLANLQADDLYQLAVTDPLTGCCNRRFFDEVIDRELAHHHRYGVPLSLLFLDVDQFKAVNDSLGHEAGDRVLQPSRASSSGMCGDPTICSDGVATSS